MKAQILYQTVGFVGVRSFGVAVGREILRDYVPTLGFSPAEDTTGTGSRWASFRRRTVLLGFSTSDSVQSFVLQANLGSCTGFNRGQR